MPAHSPTALTLILVLTLVAWRVYSRFRRLVGRQRLSRVRPWLTLTLFPLFMLGLCYASRAHPENLVVFAGAMAAGIGLGFYGLRTTQFESTPLGLYYTPNTHLGVALTLLFVARILYRGVEVYILNPGVPHGLQDFGRSPLTLAVFGLLAGYYMTYAAGLVRWRWRVGK